jgi:hypothetical protein
MVPYRVVDVGRPEPRRGAVVGVGREERWADARPGLVGVLQDDERLAHRPAAVEEDRHLPVHRVGSQQEVALARQVLLEVLVAQALEPQRHPHPDHPRARPRAQQPQLAPCSCCCGHRHRRG